jgi:hypothetical protein
MCDEIAQRNPRKRFPNVIKGDARFGDQVIVDGPAMLL